MSAEERAQESAPPTGETGVHAPLVEPLQPLPSADPEPERDTGPSSPVSEPPQGVEREPARLPPPILPNVDVHDLDWDRIATSLGPGALRSRMRATVEQLEALLDSESGLRMLFDDQRSSRSDRSLRVAELSDEPLWFIGDIHGDLLTLDAALALIDRESTRQNGERARIVLLGDLFDDGGYGLETLLRVFELIIGRAQAVCLLAGNHDEALGYNGARFTATVSPSDFSEFLNEHLSHEWIGRAGKLAVRLFTDAPRALFFPDGLLVAHGGFPLTDLHGHLADTRDWNDPRCLTDFVWTRAHPKAKKKLPNRTSRGGQFGYEDFAAFCALSATLGRTVTHMVRGHDHVDERYEIYPAYAATPVLTTVALSRRLARELYGPYVRVPTLARWIRGSLPQVYRLHIPEQHIRACYPEEIGADQASHVKEANPK